MDDKQRLSIAMSVSKIVIAEQIRLGKDDFPRQVGKLAEKIGISKKEAKEFLRPIFDELIEESFASIKN